MVLGGLRLHWLEVPFGTFSGLILACLFVMLVRSQELPKEAQDRDEQSASKFNERLFVRC